MAYCPMIKYHYNFPDPILSRVMKIKALDSADAYAKRDCRIKKCNYKLPYPVVAFLNAAVPVYRNTDCSL